MRRLAIILVAVAATMGLVPAHADDAVLAPDVDPFYVAPPSMPAAAPGTVLRSRPIAMGALGLPLPFPAWQVLYRTNDTKGNPEATVATIVLPLTPALGRRPLVSYQPAEDSLTSLCAPSYTMRQGTQAEELAMLLPLLRGWAVVVPDYEGPGSQWTAGVQAGHAVLDGIRAAENFAPAGLSGRATPVGMWGYSGGAQATTWAAELHPSYAPELDIKGVAAGGVPPDVEAIARAIDGGVAAGIYFAASVGLSRAYPELDMQSLLNDNGKAMVANIGHMCLPEAVSTYAFHHMSEYTNVPDVLVVPRVQAVIAAVRLGQRRPAVPMFIYHALLDELIPIAGTDALVARYCSQGVPVTYYRDPASEHISLVATGAPLAVTSLGQRFANQPVPSTC
jgi:hypothetical protein